METALRSAYIVVTLYLSTQETEKLFEIVKKWKVRPSVLVRRIFMYLYEGKIDYVKVLRATNEMPDSDERKYRLTLDRETYNQLKSLAEDWGSSPGTVLTRMVRLYLDGKAIEMNAIW
jgi:hypothetical protein